MMPCIVADAAFIAVILSSSKKVAHLLAGDVPVK
jgi:hypothetical protein